MVKERRHPHVAHIDEVETVSRERGRFSFRRRMLGAATGARGIGCSWLEVAPGQVAFPFHYHCRNEEAIFILSGAGTLRIGDAKVELGAGDYITFPVGPEAAHQLEATGDAPLRYLCFSTLESPEAVAYPDSNKVGVLARSPGKGPDEFWVRKWFRADSDVDYFDGEDP